MKLEIYEPHYVGYVSLNPYEWEYNGRYAQNARYLENHTTPTESSSYQTDDGEIVEVEADIQDEEQHLRRISAQLLAGKVWHTEIVQDG